MVAGQRADTPWRRMRGLIGSEPLRDGEGLWIAPCSGIHMLFMSYAIDAVYLDREGRIVAIDEHLQPWNLGRVVRGAHSVLELPAGSVSSTGSAIGDTVRVSAVDGTQAS